MPDDAAADARARDRVRGLAYRCAPVSFLWGCGGAQSALAPAGPAAREIADSWWLMLGLFGAIYVGVAVLLIYALFRRRPPAAPGAPGAEGGVERGADRATVDATAGATDRRSVRWVAFGGILFPGIVLPVLFVHTLSTMERVLREPEPAALTIDVIGRLWWWEVRYRDAATGQVIETANEIHIPVGEPVRIRLASPNVIHSFWVPRLQGKLDLIPGRVNVTWIEAERPGIYRGQCAEYCGLQHAHMAFLVIARPAAEFAAWLARQAEPAAEPADSLARRGREVFLDAGCAACHTVRGTRAIGDLGPDLTHLAGRLTLAAVTLPNTRGHLGGWIANPQRLKPGNKMPDIPLAAEAFRALLHYLEGLE